MTEKFNEIVERQLKGCWENILRSKALYGRTKDGVKSDFIGKYRTFLTKKVEAREDLEGFMLLRAVAKGAEDILEELGFVITPNSDTVHYHLYVPKFEQGGDNKPTVAQKVLLEYEKKLMATRNTSKAHFINYCETLKSKFLEGGFIVKPSSSNYMDSIIEVYTDERISNKFEWTIVSRFFIELGLEFKDTAPNDKVWKFKLYDCRNNLMPENVRFYDEVKAIVKQSFNEIVSKALKESNREIVTINLKEAYINFLCSRLEVNADLEGFTLLKVTTSILCLEVLKDLGFVIEDNNDPNYFHLSVPEFNGVDGEERTVAQSILLGYHNLSDKLLEKRKKELLAECDFIKEWICDGFYDAVPMGNTYRDIQININSVLEVGDDFSKGIVEDYFSKLGLKFEGKSDGKLKFKLI